MDVKLSCLAVACLATGVQTAAAQKSSPLTLDPKGAVSEHLGYFPISIAVSETRPKQITKEPAYKGKPKYGVIRLGNGPKSDFVFALDEPKDGPSKIYIDKNRDGDLTNDGDIEWKDRTIRGRTIYGPIDVTLRASYGTPTHETSSALYTLGLYRFPAMEKQLFTFRETAHRGRVVVDGKAHKAILLENDANALFVKTSAHPLWLQVDMLDNGKAQQVDARAPFNLAGKAYEATISPDGFEISIQHTSKVVAAPPAPARPAAPALLKSGVAAPAFVAEKWGGGNLSLADYKGKVVVLDFWATWCGPCQASMPHLEKVWRSVQNQDIAVVGVCVWDERDAYKEWVPKNQDKYTFQLAFDPAGRGDENIAKKLFKVSGIPTTYIIDKEGNVADAIVGYDEGDHRVEDALKKLGVKL